MNTQKIKNNILRPDCIIFDMDGTLWNATDSYAEIWNRCAIKNNIDLRITGADLVPYMGKSIKEIYNSIYGISESNNIDRILTDLASFENELMPILGGDLYIGVKDGLEILSQQYSLMMLSNCGKNGLKNFLTFSNLSNYFTDTITFGETSLQKADNMQLILNRNNLKSCIYIGDTQQDCDETHKAGMKFGFASYGFGKCSNYDFSFDSFPQLVEFLMII